MLRVKIPDYRDKETSFPMNRSISPISNRRSLGSKAFYCGTVDLKYAFGEKDPILKEISLVPRDYIPTIYAVPIPQEKENKKMNQQDSIVKQEDLKQGDLKQPQLVKQEDEEQTDEEQKRIRIASCTPLLIHPGRVVGDSIEIYNMTVFDLLSEIRNILRTKIPGCAYTFKTEKEKPYFKAVYVNGSRYCDFCISLYMSSRAGYIVGITSGNKFTSRVVYREITAFIKSQLYFSAEGDVFHQPFHQNVVFSFEPEFPHVPKELKSDTEMHSFVLRIISEADSAGNDDARLVNARIICDNCETSPSFREHFIRLHGLRILNENLKSEFFMLEQLATSTLFFLVSQSSEITKVVASDSIMSTLLSFLNEGRYAYTVMKRDAATAFKKVITEYPLLVKRKISKKMIFKWCREIESVQDSTLKQIFLQIKKEFVYKSPKKV